ncbi:MAG: MFS transporter [Anaerolineae bacterium]
METQTQTSAPNRNALIFIVVVVILNTLGLTLIAPVAPFLVARYVSDPNAIGVAVGWLSSIYAICQFVAAPALGLLSDHFGRRPLLLICLLGSAVGYLFLGVGGALWVLFLGRAIDGLTGANTSIIIAYITDVVPSAQRSRYFGMIGAIGAVSVVLGPAVGGLIAKLGYEVPFYVAGAIALISVFYGLFFMPESLSRAQRVGSIRLAKLNPLTTLSDVFAQPQLRWLLIALFLYTLSTIILPSNLGLFTRDILSWDADTVGVLFSIFGIASVVVQGVLLQWLLKRMIASRVTLAGLWFTAIALLLVGLVGVLDTSALLYVGVVVFALGDGFTSPTLLDLITRGTDERSQGKVQGGSQSMQSLANILGPVLAGALYDHLGRSSPYWGGAVIVLLAIVAALWALPAFRKFTASTEDTSGSNA